VNTSTKHRHGPGRTAATATVALALAVSATAGIASTAPAAGPVTECDRLASHPEDGQRVAPGVERQDIDIPRALAVCASAVADAPANGRLRYQYARLLFYGNQTADAMREMRRAADDGHAQAQFVFGTFITRNRPDAPKDVCLAESYWKKSGAGGRQAARVQYLRYTLKGAFDACPGKASDDELVDILSAAQEASRNFYEGLLLEDLAEALTRRVAAAPGG
jgi:hypothetical protein